MKQYKCKHSRIIEDHGTTMHVNNYSFRSEGFYSAVCQHCLIELLEKSGLLTEISQEDSTNAHHTN